MERKLTTLRKTRMEFFLNHSDLLLMMRCRHCDLDLTRFQVQEKGVKKPPPFADTHSGLTLFILALRRAKSLEIGVDEDHNAGWDYLIKQAEDLLERGFALASPHDVYDFVKATFEVFSLEHRDGVNNARDVTDYPSFENLADEDDTVSGARKKDLPRKAVC